MWDSGQLWVDAVATATTEDTGSAPGSWSWLPALTCIRGMRTHFLFGGFGPFRLLPGPACLPPPSWLAVTWLRTAHSTTGTALDLSGSLNPGPVQPEPQGRGVSPFPPPWFFASACPGLDFTRRTSVGSSAPVGSPHPSTGSGTASCCARNPLPQPSKSLHVSDCH